MFGRRQLSHWFFAVGLVSVLAGLGAVAPEVRFTASAQAQTMDQRYLFLRRQHQHSGASSFFEQLFGGFNERPAERVRPPVVAPPPREHVDYSRAPPPPKPQPNAAPPTTTIVVMGDGMADWLAYGLEDAFSDSPDVAIVRKDEPHSGLIRYKWHSDLDWWHVARDDLAQEKANYVVMMLGVNDRRNISEKEVAKQAEKDQKEQKAQNAQSGNAQNQAQADNSDQPLIAAPERKYPRGIIPFRSDRWAAVYSHRIDQTIAALKSKGVPVFWVGLPSIRGTRSTADAVYLNDLFRARAERAGITYVDIWDGFVDDSGKYSSYGPDYEGQTRRLRSADGVYFTKYGARKLAHYVEREIRRYMSNRVVNLPTGPMQSLPGNGQRPLVGPVIPLTVAPASATVLDGGPGMHLPPDPLVTKVLVKGDALKAPYGRADDFAWPPGSDANKKPAAPGNAATAPASAVANAAPTATAPAPTAPAAAAPNAPVRAVPLSPSTAKQVAPAQAKEQPVKPEAPAAIAVPAKPAEAEKPVAVARPAEAERPIAKPAEARMPATRRGREEERTAERARSRRLLPPALIREHPPARQHSDSLFGPNGPFGWLR